MGLDGHATADREKCQVDRPKLDIALLRTLAASGSFRTEIGERLGIHSTTVAKAAKANGIVIPYDRRSQKIAGEWWDGKIEQALVMKAEGLPLAEIAGRLGTTKNALAGKLFRVGACKPGPRKTDSEFWRQNTDEMLRLKSEGWSDRRIAKHLGIPHGTVHSRRKTLENRAAREPLPKIEFPPPGHCLFPDGDMPALTFCGAEAEGDGRPYCHHHARKAYLPPKAVDMRLAA